MKSLEEIHQDLCSSKGCPGTECSFLNAIDLDRANRLAAERNRCIKVAHEHEINNRLASTQNVEMTDETRARLKYAGEVAKEIEEEIRSGVVYGAGASPQEIIENERKHLATVVCHDCKKGTELVKDLNGRYCHRTRKHDWLDDCYAAEIHDLLRTTAYQMKEEDAGA